jgi:AcrR family transcriptional regulator
MASDNVVDEEEPGDGDARWRERALERSLRSARARALSRSDRFLTAASELLQETGRIDFTVQEIVERSRMSLRSFYQHFASKDELLLALFEESIRSYIGRLREAVEKYEDPIDRLRAYVWQLHGATGSSSGPMSRALTNFHLRLAVTQPPELAHALEPQAELLREIIQAGVDSQQFRQDVEPGQLAMILLQTLVAALHMNVLGTHVTGVRIGVEELWAFCIGGVSPPAPTESLIAAPIPWSYQSI